jgi:hypothetical protein
MVSRKPYALPFPTKKEVEILRRFVGIWLADHIPTLSRQNRKDERMNHDMYILTLILF